MNALGETAELHHNETCKRGFIYSFTGDAVIQIFPDIENAPKRLSAFWALVLQATNDDFLLHYNGLQVFRIKRIGVINIFDSGGELVQDNSCITECNIDFVQLSLCKYLIELASKPVNSQWKRFSNGNGFSKNIPTFLLCRLFENLLSSPYLFYLLRSLIFNRD